jgi:hypothetical protein
LRRVGGVGLDEHGGAIATEEIAGEILRYVDDELDLAALEEVARLALGVHLLYEVEEGTILQRIEEGAPLRAVIGEENCRGQMTWVGIDRESEEEKLEQGNAEHHREGESIAPHLGKLLHDNGPEPVG